MSAADLDVIAQARQVGPQLRAASGDRDRLAGWLLLELADRLERLGGDLGEIRALLAGFDWERDDRQYALERIEMIVDGGQA